MKIIKPFAEIVDISKMSRLTMMEMVGRLCYRSEDKINPESAEDFIKGVICKQHKSVTEFAIFTFRIETIQFNFEEFLMLDNKYLVIDILDDGAIIITGTARALREAIINNPHNHILNFILIRLRHNYPILFGTFIPTICSTDYCDLLTPDDIAHLPTHVFKRHKFAMVHYVVNRAVSHELVRHRPVSWMQESQRYCRYSEDKFDNEVAFIDPRGGFPTYFEEPFNYSKWYSAMQNAEDIYMNLLLAQKLSPQAARTILPNSCKTELYQLCNLEEWEIFFGLRDAPGKAEPSMVEVVAPLHQEFKDIYPDVFGEPVADTWTIR